ncbi:MAG: ribulose-phosphate 3-epimerase [Kiritimatiellae bacterium]|nr:ribulose-phosphate 3-epimerase [Kiritimatiellia bacterium]
MHAHASKHIEIMPSLLAADFGRFYEEIRRAEAAGADALHLDIMDGHFVPNISFGPDVVRMARGATERPLDVHLMLDRPDQHVAAFCEAGSSRLLIHVEARCDVGATLDDIRARGVRPGVTLNPETPAEMAFPWLDSGQAEEILCMAVHPGFGGQAFMPSVLPKLKALRERYPALEISVDGGIGDEFARACAAAGANLLVAGTTLFRAPDMKEAILRMRAAAMAGADA